MTQKRVRARNATSARKKAGSKNIVVTSVNFIPGSKHGGMRTYAVRTKKRE